MCKRGRTRAKSYVFVGKFAKIGKTGGVNGDDGFRHQTSAFRVRCSQSVTAQAAKSKLQRSDIHVGQAIPRVPPWYVSPMTLPLGEGREGLQATLSISQ